MSTNRQMISSIRTEHKLLSADSIISDRAILAELRRCARKLIKQQTDKRRLWQTDTLFTPIPCLEMIEVSISECCDYISLDTISRSKYKLPRIGEGIFQYMIKSVMNITNTQRITELSPERYINILKLKKRRDEIYYWISNAYLYITSPEIRAVKISAYFEEDVPSYFNNPKCKECQGAIVLCPPNPYDDEFRVPGFLEKDVIDMTSQKLLGSYHKLKIDQTSDNRDEQTNET